MTRIALWFASTVAAVVLLFSYSTSTSAQMTATGTSDPISGTLDSTTTSSAPSGGSSVTGQMVMTRYGPVQVALTTSNGTITGVTVVRYPDSDGRDIEINQHALPILVQETLDAQSASIDMVSGATYTSAGYEESLQSALDQAGL